MSVIQKGRGHGSEAPIDQMCSWGNCTLPTDGYPICPRHLRKAWAVVQVQLNGASDTPTTQEVASRDAQ